MNNALEDLISGFIIGFGIGTTEANNLEDSPEIRNEESFTVPSPEIRNEESFTVPLLFSTAYSAMARLLYSTEGMFFENLCMSFPGAFAGYGLATGLKKLKRGFTK